ncbi:hypothetical protein MC7420_8069 [Coleofasciculus chthonoplastes PCC 7420]|uniref:Uncharacterized protein n=1 Tax=Coleofasciculus chthonoplastes PCC 7420 TaxID=118168 RepID=B4W5I4_9CYAN|nr:hypothetical protein [Coleofasciculus chthonoplastes]EDX70555.1 hypothetical protein MC7420_8069 [Coleofasciculus chthonoplastes PCC 7420]
MGFVGTISNPSQIQLSNLSATAFKGVSLSGNCINQGYFTYEQKLLSARLGSFSLFSVTGIDLQYRLVYNPPGQSSIQICCNCPLDPIDDCPDLNITIRGTLLPARRGTARISGDWCKSLSCDGSYNKFLKTRDLE